MLRKSVRDKAVTIVSTKDVSFSGSDVAVGMGVLWALLIRL